MSSKLHSERKHSKFSASGADRWFNCPGSVELSEGLPDKDSVWSLEGTKAHEVLETTMGLMMRGVRKLHFPDTPAEMITYAFQAAAFILNLAEKHPHSEVLVETRIHLSFIHPAMFGTFDGAVIDHFGTLHVFDYKYGAGVSVSPTKNLQMIFYGIGLAYLYDWNFKRVRLWIIQPRIKGYDGPVFWELSIDELRAYVPLFKAAVRRVLKEPKTYAEGSWCHFCKAKGICPLKEKLKIEKAIAVFTAHPVELRNPIQFDSESV